MKKYIAKFWRNNPQLANGGYETTRTIEAKTITSARKKAREICDGTSYGSRNAVRRPPRNGLPVLKMAGQKG